MPRGGWARNATPRRLEVQPLLTRQESVLFSYPCSSAAMILLPVLRERCNPPPGCRVESIMKSVALLLFSAAAVWGQTVPGRYVVELAGDPAATAAAQQGSRFAARETGFVARRAAVRQSQTDARTRIGELGGTILGSMDTVVNALMVSIPDARAAELSKVPGVLKCTRSIA